MMIDLAGEGAQYVWESGGVGLLDISKTECIAKKVCPVLILPMCST